MKTPCYNTESQHWDAKGDIPPVDNGEKPLIIWENSGENGTSYQRYKADLTFDKNNRMYITVPINKDDASNIFNYVVFAYSDDGGNTFKKLSGNQISLPISLSEGEHQGDLLDGYYNANMGEHSGILLDQNNNPGVFYSVDGATSYKYSINKIFSEKQTIFSDKQCNRCLVLSDQDNGVMTIVDNSNWYRFSKYGDSFKKINIGKYLLRFDYRALKEAHIYRAIVWVASTGQFNIYRIDFSNPTKCY